MRAVDGLKLLAELTEVDQCRGDALIRLCKSGMPNSLRRLMDDVSVAKAGLNARGDAQKMHRDFGVLVRGVVELNDEAAIRLVGERNGQWGLAALVQRILCRTLPKNKNDRMSNWEAETLSAEQMR